MDFMIKDIKEKDFKLLKALTQALNIKFEVKEKKKNKIKEALNSGTTEWKSLEEYKKAMLKR